MHPHLAPLRYGQQFHLLQDEVGVSPYGSGEGNYYNLKRLDDPEDIGMHRLCMVRSSDTLVADNVYWAFGLCEGIVGGWAVMAFRLSDRKRFGFFQHIADKLWNEHWLGYAAQGQTPEAVFAVGNVGWPAPTPESLMWATEALANEQVPGSGTAGLSEAFDLSKIPLEQGVPQALALLKGWRVPNLEAVLRERGFQV